MSSFLPQHSSESLWVRAQAKVLKRFVAAKVRDECVREDVVQETLTRLLTYSRQNAIDNLAALGRTIALNLISDHFRRKSERPTEVIDDLVACENPLQEQVMIHKQRLDRFSRVLAKMPALRREVLIRRRLRGESHAEIAKALKLSPEAVEKHMTRALRQLHEDTQTRG
jgi:RNA polymerase sigma factor (sigma-70 family)